MFEHGLKGVRFRFDFEGTHVAPPTDINSAAEPHAGGYFPDLDSPHIVMCAVRRAQSVREHAMIIAARVNRLCTLIPLSRIPKTHRLSKACFKNAIDSFTMEAQAFRLVKVAAQRSGFSPGVAGRIFLR